MLRRKKISASYEKCIKHANELHSKMSEEFKGTGKQLFFKTLLDDLAVLISDSSVRRDKLDKVRATELEQEERRLIWIERELARYLDFFGHTIE